MALFRVVAGAQTEEIIPDSSEPLGNTRINGGDVGESPILVNSKGASYPKVNVEGYGEVPFPDGPLYSKQFQSLRSSFTTKYKAEFKEWWIKQGRPWPQVPSGSQLQIHHIKPLQYGGTNAFDNLVPLVYPSKHQPFTSWWAGF